MELKPILAKLGEPDTAEVLRPHWEASEATFPGKRPSFLTPAEFKASREWSGLGPEIDPILEETADRIAANPALLRLAWHGYRLMFETPDYNGFRDWPALEHVLSKHCGVFYLLLSLAAVPRLRAVHNVRHVPEQITRHTALDIRIGAHRYKSITSGRPGMERRLLSWHRLVSSGDLYRLGRMQYVLRPFRGQVQVYRNRSTDRVLALSRGCIRFNGEGYVDGAGGITDAENSWTSCLTETETTVTGSPVSPRGMAIRPRVTLSLSEWTCALAPGDPVLEMHIPEGGPLTLEACCASMRQALDFFPKYEPDRPFVSFACYSWIFNTQLENMRLPASNLVRYQRELYLFPTPSSGKDGLYFIFYKDDVDIETAPRDTTLKRAFLDHLAAGIPLRNGGMFMLKDDFRRFGTQHYRSQWPPLPGIREKTNEEYPC